MAKQINAIARTTGLTLAHDPTPDVPGGQPSLPQADRWIIYMTGVDGGTWSLTFYRNVWNTFPTDADQGSTTSPLAWNISAGSLETALLALSNMDSLIGVTGSGTSDDPWIITFETPTPDTERINAFNRTDIDLQESEEPTYPTGLTQVDNNDGSIDTIVALPTQSPPSQVVIAFDVPEPAIGVVRRRLVVTIGSSIANLKPSPAIVVPPVGLTDEIFRLQLPTRDTNGALAYVRIKLIDTDKTNTDVHGFSQTLQFTLEDVTPPAPNAVTVDNVDYNVLSTSDLVEAKYNLTTPALPTWPCWMTTRVVDIVRTPANGENIYNTLQSQRAYPYAESNTSASLVLRAPGIRPVWLKMYLSAPKQTPPYIPVDAETATVRIYDVDCMGRRSAYTSELSLDPSSIGGGTPPATPSAPTVQRFVKLSASDDAIVYRIDLPQADISKQILFVERVTTGGLVPVFGYPISVAATSTYVDVTLSMGPVATPTTHKLSVVHIGVDGETSARSPYLSITPRTDYTSTTSLPATPDAPYFVALSKFDIAKYRLQIGWYPPATQDPPIVSRQYRTRRWDYRHPSDITTTIETATFVDDTNPPGVTLLVSSIEVVEVTIRDTNIFGLTSGWSTAFEFTGLSVPGRTNQTPAAPGSLTVTQIVGVGSNLANSLGGRDQPTAFTSSALVMSSWVNYNLRFPASQSTIIARELETIYENVTTHVVLSHSQELISVSSGNVPVQSGLATNRIVSFELATSAFGAIGTRRATMRYRDVGPDFSTSAWSEFYQLTVTNDNVVNQVIGGLLKPNKPETPTLYDRVVVPGYGGNPNPHVKITIQLSSVPNNVVRIVRRTVTYVTSTGVEDFVHIPALNVDEAIPTDTVTTDTPTPTILIGYFPLLGEGVADNVTITVRDWDCFYNGSDKSDALVVPIAAPSVTPLEAPRPPQLSKITQIVP